MGEFPGNSPAAVEGARSRLLANVVTTAAIVVYRPVAVVAPQVAPFAWLRLAVSPAGSAAGSRTVGAHPAADGVRPLPPPLPLPAPLVRLATSSPAPASFMASTSTWAAPTSPAAS